jgi:DNA-binding transcriptional ArsR family regulator
MSSNRPKRRAALYDRAAVFAALGDETRLALVGRLSRGEPQSITQLADGMIVTRQAITKHLRVLEGAGVVRGIKLGRENRFELRPQPLEDVRAYLADVSDQWDQALTRLRAFVEK